MDSVKITYIEEANELLANLEISLLSLENSSEHDANVEEVFRIMHTLKGNSSMFGLTAIADFVHNLETIYDKIRIKEVKLTKNLLDLTFQSLDHLKNIIHDSNLEVSANKVNHNLLFGKILKIVSNEASVNQNIQEDNTSAKSGLKTFHIYFEPNETIFNNGTNPLYLIAELTSLGNYKCIPHFKKSVSFEDFDATKCITYWDVILETEKSINDIKDVFVFVEDNSTIIVNELLGTNYLANNNFVKYILAGTFLDTKLDVKEIESLFKTEPVLQEEHIDHHKKSDTKEKSSSSIRVSSEKLDELMNLVSELVTTQAALTLFTEKNKTGELETITENIEKLSRRLRDMAFGMTLVPINNLFGRFQRMVRDVSNQLGKEIQFITEGGETELDKTIIETLTDPLMHILRNSLDHGIEKPEDRIAKGKERAGKLTLKSFYSGAFVYVQIIDDGKGIDVEAVREKAISKGLIKKDDILSNSQLFEFIFHPGFSTAKQVTDVSGRGVGMDVVKRNITDIKGTISVDSEVNKGTSLTIKLPLTLSIIDGLLVAIENVNYIIPLSVITKCYEVNSNSMMNNFNKLLLLDDEQVPFINTRAEFGHETLENTNCQIIVVNNGDGKVGVSVDNIIGEYQAVVKPLGKYYKQQDFISGASILGDGTIALVLDTAKIIDIHTQNKN